VLGGLAPLTGLTLAAATFIFLSSCDTREVNWLGTPSIYYQSDEHDGGCIRSTPRHPAGCRFMYASVLIGQRCRPGSSRAGQCVLFGIIVL
jgi:hypothetical protein